VSEDIALNKLKACRKDWNKFARDILQVNLDKEQQDIVNAFNIINGKRNKWNSKGKRFCSCSLRYLLYVSNAKMDLKTGEMIANTKIAMTAPTFPQINNIMFP
jgi:hypothetical protein